uniref:Potassium channel domain-containing protein n=1 Tax=Plectus sambesii TaxID=2011161 RepID=A0A914X7Y7_9BILA
MGLASLVGDPALSDRIGAIGRKTTFLFVVLLSYLLLGAIVFQFIEYKARDEEVQDAVAELELERAQLLEVRRVRSHCQLLGASCECIYVPMCGAILIYTTAQMLSAVDLAVEGISPQTAPIDSPAVVSDEGRRLTQTMVRVKNSPPAFHCVTIKSA